MHRHLALALLIAASLVAEAADAADCGGPIPCRVDGGEYRIALPPDGPAAGALVFFHGYRGSAEGQMRAAGLVAAAHRHGLAFVAPDGAGNTWSHAGSPTRLRDETAFVGAVLDDLEARFGFGPADVLAGGFSQGASMAFYALCDHPGRFSGAVTFAGVFWTPAPGPEDCAGVPPMVHVHGRGDTIFPLAGRAIRDTFRQGDTFRAMATMEAGAGCAPPAPQAVPGLGACEVAGGCARGDMALCLHEGGHEVRGEWLDAALGWLGR